MMFFTDINSFIFQLIVHLYQIKLITFYNTHNVLRPASNNTEPAAIAQFCGTCNSQYFIHIVEDEH